MADEVSVRIEADASQFLSTLNNLKSLSTSFGSELSGALKQATVSGKGLDDVLRRVASNLAGKALGLGLQPLSTLGNSMLASMVGQVAGRVTPFAKGGVVNGAQHFALGSGVGLMGEAGAEAIMPLARGSDGRLGVAAGGAGSAINVTFNVQTPDAASFRKSEAQISAMLVQAVSRGTRTR